jgi:hypothetical protein
MADPFVEVDHAQLRKKGQAADGDVFLSLKTDSGRIIAVLSDGLGSGVKAGVLATLTATMASKFVAEDIPIRRAAGIIMNTLPVCKVRKISYATFSIVDIEPSGAVRIIEYDNPPYLLIRGGAIVELAKSEIRVKRPPASGGRLPEAVMRYSEFQAKAGDRIVFFSDGVTQAGMGTRAWPLGWGISEVRAFALGLVGESPTASARELAHEVVTEALANDAFSARDDISCGVVYFREPRRLLVMTGPSVDKARDREMAESFRSFEGRRVVAGGTTATILSRELGTPVRMNLKDSDRVVPPSAEMEGADFVTEGIITLGKAAEYLEHPELLDRGHANAASRIVDLLLDSDIIDFVVGTKINEAHQDPAMPVELEIRRNIVKRIASLLDERYLKKTSIRFI